MYYGCFAKTVFLEDLVVRALSAAGMLLGYIVCTRMEGPGPGGLIRTYVYIYIYARAGSARAAYRWAYTYTIL